MFVTVNMLLTLREYDASLVDIDLQHSLHELPVRVSHRGHLRCALEAQGTNCQNADVTVD